MLGPSGSGKTTVLRHDRRLRDARSRHRLPRRRRRHGAGALRARRQHGLPGLRTVSPHERPRQRGLRLAGARGGQSASARVGRRRSGAGTTRLTRRSQAHPVVRRPTPAGGPRARARHQTEGAAARRTAGCARPQASRGDAGRAQGLAARRGHHVHLRHSRPRRGAHHERPRGGLQQRPDRADRYGRRDLRATRVGVRRGVRRDEQSDQGGRRREAPRAHRARTASGPRRFTSTPIWPPRSGQGWSR